MTPRIVVVRAPAKRVVVRGMTLGARGQVGTADIHRFDFTSPAATWTVRHNLGRTPIVDVLGADGAQLVAQVEHPDVNTAVVTHSTPVTGSVLVL